MPGALGLVPGTLSYAATGAAIAIGGALLINALLPAPRLRNKTSSDSASPVAYWLVLNQITSQPNTAASTAPASSRGA